jgi:hypothetical protein
MTASEQRDITVKRENTLWQEYDREVAVELWHNQHQTTVLRLSPAEAATLRDKLVEHLKGGRG